MWRARGGWVCMQRAFNSILLALPGALAIIAAIVMSLMKLTEIGMGPDLSWATMAAVGALGLALLSAASALATRAAVAANAEFMKEFDADRPAWFDR